MSVCGKSGAGVYKSFKSIILMSIPVSLNATRVSGNHYLLSIGRKHIQSCLRSARSFLFNRRFLFKMDEFKNDSINSTDAVVLPTERQADVIVLEEMARAGILFGRRKMRTNPKMRKYIYTTRNGFEIFDLTLTLDAIERAKNFLRDVAKSGRLILFVGTQAAGQSAVKFIGDQFHFPFIAERWLGGTLTNYGTISERLAYYMKLKADQVAGRLDKYTKKERTAMDKEIARLTRLFGGLETMNALPGAVVIVGARAHEIAIAEANRARIPAVVLANTDADPDVINYIIPANDNNVSSIVWVMNKLAAGIEEGLKEKILNAEAKKEVKAK